MESTYYKNILLKHLQKLYLYNGIRIVYINMESQCLYSYKKLNNDFHGFVSLDVKMYMFLAIVLSYNVSTLIIDLLKLYLLLFLMIFGIF